MSEENGSPSPEEEEKRENAEPGPPPDRAELKSKDGTVLKVQFHRPKPGRAYEILYAGVKSDIKAGCCALGLSSKAIQRQVPFQHDVLDFGDKVLDWLLARGVPFLDIRNAAFAAYNYATDDVIDTSEVDAAEGFSEAPEAASTT